MAAAAPATPAASAAAVAAASAPSAFANLPLQREESASVGLPLAAQLAIAATLVVAIAIVYRLRQRRSIGGRAKSDLHTGQALRLTQGASLHVVYWGEEELLVASSGNSVTVLSQRNREADARQHGGVAS